MAEKVYSNSSTSASSDTNALQLINDISNDLQGRDAPIMGGQLTKSRILAKLNDAIDWLAGEAKWKWLKTWTTVKGYSVDTNTTSTLTSATGTITDSSLLGTSSGTSYWAEKITSESKYLTSPTSLVLSMNRAGGLGLLNGILTMYICPDSSGSPDIDNPIFTSTAIVITNRVTDTGVTIDTFETDVTFTFPNSEDTVLLKTTDYWFVCKFVAAANNGEGIACTRNPITSTTSKIRLNGASSWTSFTTGRFDITLNYNPASYLSVITLGSNYEDILRVAANDISNPSTNFRPYSDNKYILNDDFLPFDKFTVRRIVDGTTTIEFGKTLEKLTIYVEYYKTPDHIADDTDIPECPKQYRYVLKERAKYYLAKMGLGIDPNTTKKEAEIDANRGIEKMKKRYVDHPSGLRVRRTSKISVYPNVPSSDIPNAGRLRNYWRG